MKVFCCLNLGLLVVLLLGGVSPGDSDQSANLKYYVVRTSQVSWAAAACNCHKIKMELVKDNSLQDNFLSGLVRNSNGAALNFWTSSHGDAFEDCVYWTFSNKSLQKGPCETKNSYICQGYWPGTVANPVAYPAAIGPGTVANSVAFPAAIGPGPP